MFLIGKSERIFKRQQAEAYLSTAWSLFFALVLMLWPWTAFADESSRLGNIICNVKTNLAFYPRALNAAVYCVGMFLILRSLYLFKTHADNPGQSKVAAGSWHLIGGGLLVSLPFFAGVLQRAIIGNAAGAGDFGCKPDSAAAEAGASLDKMMQAFVKNIHGPMLSLISLICVLVGLTYIATALMRAAKTGSDPRAADPKGIVVHLVFGAALISIAPLVTTTLQSVFGSNTVNSMTDIKLIQWSKITNNTAGTENADKTIAAILAFIQIVGFMSFVRGWLVLKKAVEGGGQATIPQGMAHIIGGVMAINIDASLKVLDKTFGTNVMNGNT